MPVGHLSYSALALYEHCGYRFYVERVLGAREALAPAPGEAAPRTRAGDPRPSCAEPGAVRGHALGIGNAVHAALEWSAQRGWAAADDELLERLLGREGLAGDAEALAARAPAGRRLARLRAARRARRRRRGPRCRSCSASAGTVVRGKIDLLVDGGGRSPTVVDYKTDALDGRSPGRGSRRATRPSAQVYALAAGGDDGRARDPRLPRGARRAA